MAVLLIDLALAGVLVLALVDVPRLLPAGRLAMSPAEHQALGRRTSWITLGLFLPLFLLFMFVLTGVWTIILNDIAEWRQSRLPPAAFIIGPEPSLAFWMLPSLLLGIVSAPAPCFAVLRTILSRQRFAEFQTASMQPGIDSRKALHCFAGGCAIVVGMWVVVGLNWCARFEEERIVLRPLLEVGEKVYSYQDVDRLIQTSQVNAPNGNPVERRCLFILFRDGRLWSTEDFGSRDGAALAERDQELRDFLSRKTGKALEAARAIEDVTGR